MVRVIAVACMLTSSGCAELLNIHGPDHVTHCETADPSDDAAVEAERLCRSAPPADDRTWWCVLARGADDRTHSACVRHLEDCGHVTAQLGRLGYRTSTCQPRGHATCFSARSGGEPTSQCFHQRGECDAAQALASSTPELTDVTACALVR